MIRFGGPVFAGKDNGKAAKAGESHGATVADPAALARAHREKGYTSAYAPRISVNDTDMIKQVRKAFEAEGVMLAEVGYWDNLLDTDPETRKKNRQCMMDAMILAEELGARCAVDILGSYCHGNGNSKHEPGNFSEKAFEEAVELARYYIDAVKPKTAYFVYEIFPFNVVDSPKTIDKLVKAVDRKQFGVHLDLVNLINSPRAYWSSGGIIRECTKLFGDRIVAAHVKDIKMKEPAISVILEEVPAGTGNLDMGAFIHEIHKLPQEVPFMMEHLVSEEEYDRAAEYIRKTAAREGIII